MDATLKFEPFGSSVDPEFWHIFEKKKLHDYKLDNTPKAIFGTYQIGGQYAEIKARIRIGNEAYNAHQTADKFSFVSPGQIRNANTVEEFKAYDKQAILKESAKEIYDSIQSGEWIFNPSILTRFNIISYADLKAHKFYYWFAFTAITPSSSGNNDKITLASPSITRLSNEAPFANALAQVQAKYDAFQAQSKLHAKGFFVVTQNLKTNELLFHPLNSYGELKKQTDLKCYLGMADPSSQETNPGWPLRNYLIAAGTTWNERKFSVICVREVAGKQDFSHSIFFDVQLPEVLVADKEAIQSVGWEKNTKQQLGPRTADVGSMMDPIRLAESSVGLNLQLMKWRMFPALNVDEMGKTRCLLIGAGTLGCHVARNLLAWGIFNITLLDRTRVSFSNPVRQPLYVYEHCLYGGKAKAETAAESLKQIYPKVNAVGLSLDIPMPGHPAPAEREKVKQDVDKLEKLIEDHDVVFLLTDTRESRWLPSVIALQKNKIVINAALGFESYVVMRHGQLGQEEVCNGFPRLGCYFCNDVVAPVDSTKDRTLDQQCTVTRPGVSAIAGACAVELLVAMMHHPLKGRAPYDILAKQQNENISLSLIPHQIRGSMTNFQNALLFGTAYQQCTACSNVVLDKYTKEGFNFLEMAFNTPSVLEEITGLKELHEKTRLLAEKLDAVSDDEGSVENNDNDDDDGFDVL